MVFHNHSNFVFISHVGISSTHSACPRNDMSHNHGQALWWGLLNCCGRSIILLWYVTHCAVNYVIHFQHTPFTNLELKPKENVKQICMAFDAPLIFIWIGCSYNWHMTIALIQCCEMWCFKKLYVGGDIAQFCPFCSHFLHISITYSP